MADDGKKISFGFSKSIKKTALKNVPPPEEKKIDYIDCVDDKAIKIIGGEEKEDKPLVIPMLGSKTWHDRIIHKVDADIFEQKPNEPSTNQTVQEAQIKQERLDVSDVQNNTDVQTMDASNIKNELDADVPMSLEELAAREIIEDLKSEKNKIKQEKVLQVPISDNDDLRGKEESTLEDYENVPIEDFGKAMLRGMGWNPEKGIGKNGKVVSPVLPEMRPKGMGLGVDKKLLQKVTAKSKDNEQLKLVKGAFVKIIAGKHGGSYGRIEGLDDDTARMILKLALGGEILSINELWVQPVSAEEYAQNSKVLNVKKYEEYKKIENQSKKESYEISSDSNDDCNKKYKEKSKKRSKIQRSGSSGDSSERESKRKRDLSSNNFEKKKKQKKERKSRKDRDSSNSSCDRKSKKKRDLSNPKKKKKSRNGRDSSESSVDTKLRKKRDSSHSSIEQKPRKKRNYSTSSDEDQRRKKSKKSHKRRDSSAEAERSSRKNRKKDKEREKSRHKKSDYSDPSERARSRRHRKSRSRSNSPRDRKRE